MKLLKKTGLLLFISCLSLSCNEDSSDDTGSSKLSTPEEVAKYMNANLNIQGNFYTVNPDDVTVDDTIEILSNNTGTIGLEGGTSMTNTISYSAPNANVKAVGMRFGDTGPIYFVNVDGSFNQATTGSFDFNFMLTPEICNNLSSICHDIRCYEFAQTTSGQISAANIQNVAMLCGRCNEPSCEGLVDPTACFTALGMGQFNFSSTATGNINGGTTCSGGTMSGVDTSTGTVLAFVNTPQSGSITFSDGYYTNGCNSCPAIQITTTTGESYYTTSGTGNWNNGILTFNVTMTTISNPNTSIAFSGAFRCP